MIAAIVLLFPSDVTAELVQYSAEFGDSTVLLNNGQACPHATVAQFDCTDSEVEQIWQDVLSLQQYGGFDCSFGGLCLLPALSGECWVEIPVLGGKDLGQLQEDVLRLPTLNGKAFYNGTGRMFRPHVTVARFEQGFPFRPVPLPAQLLRRTTAASIALGPTGENFTFMQPWHSTSE